MSKERKRGKISLLSVLILILILAPVTQAQEISYEEIWVYDTYDSVYDVALYSDGWYIVVASGTMVYLLDWYGGLVWSYDIGYYVYDVAISYDNLYIVAATDTTLYLFSWQGELLGTDSVWSYETSDYVYDGQTTYDGSYSVTPTETGVYLSDWNGDLVWSYYIGSYVNDVTISSDGSYIAVGDNDGGVHLFRFYPQETYSDIIIGQTLDDDPFLLVSSSPELYTTTPTPYTPYPYPPIWDIIGSILILFAVFILFPLIGYAGIRGIRNRRDRVKTEGTDSAIVNFKEVEPEAIEPEEKESQAPSEFTPQPTSPSTFPPELRPMYTDIKYLGKGGFSRVFKANRVSDEKEVAVKIPISLDEATGKSFLKEIKAWEGLNHPNIVELYDMNIMPLPYFEMEYVGGESLEGVKKPVNVEKAARIVFDIAEGLKYAHGMGIIHRDLKPHNILLTTQKLPKITDWGLSKVLAESKTSSVVGFSPIYAAPEQISPKQFGKTDKRTDIWQLGVIFYELVSGKLPFSGESVAEISHSIINEGAVPPSILNPEADEVEDIILKCLEKRMDKRYQSVEEVQREIAEFLKKGYKKSMKKSMEKRDITRSRIFCSDLVLMSAGLEDYTEVLKYLSIMKDYACKKEEKADIENLIKELKFRLSEDIMPGEELLEKVKILVYRVKTG